LEDVDHQGTKQNNENNKNEREEIDKQGRRK
jgi:hypothetical protein